MSERLQPGAPVIMINDTSRWPVVRISDQHVFQPGAQGGLEPDAYLRQPRTPVPDDTAPEAEWGAEPGLTAAVAAWCAEHGHPMITITFHGPQAPSAAVAATFRTWYRDRGENDRRLIVPSFILTDPWLTITRAAVPFWTFFSVQSALDSLAKFPHDIAFMGRYDTHLDKLSPARRIWSPLPVDRALAQLRAARLSVS